MSKLVDFLRLPTLEISRFLIQVQNSSRWGLLDGLSHSSPPLSINPSFALSINQCLYSQLSLMRGRSLESSKATGWLALIRGRNGDTFCLPRSRELTSTNSAQSIPIAQSPSRNMHYKSDTPFSTPSPHEHQTETLY